MKILPLIVLVGCAVWGTETRAQEEERAAPARGGLLKRGLLAKSKQTTTTTTTTAAPQEDEYVDEAEYQEGEAQASSEAPPTSTEGKKLVAGGVRPFRSNTDLLEALKRRRAQAAEAKLQHSGSAVAPVANTAQDSVAAEPPAKANYSKKRFNSAVGAHEETLAPKPARARFGRPGPAAKSVAEAEAPEPSEPVAAAPSLRAGRTFRRGN